MKKEEYTINMRKRIGIILLICLAIIIIILSYFYIKKMDGKEEVYNNIGIELPVGKASNLLNEKEYKEVEKLLNEAGLDNIKTFLLWVKEFNEEPIEGSGMVEEWTETKKIEYNDGVLANRWEKVHEQTDSDCRMTAFLLLKNHISMNKTISENGSYLMFDIDAIDNNKNYEILKQNRNEFITLFNEIDVKDTLKEEIKNAYSNKWKEYGISIKEGNVSLITVVMHDNYDNIAYIGHTGVLIELNNKIVFIEKIAFEQPYQISILEARDDLKNMLFSRKTYFRDNTEEGPFIYENDKLLFSYK